MSISCKPFNPKGQGRQKDRRDDRIPQSPRTPHQPPIPKKPGKKGPHFPRLLSRNERHILQNLQVQNLLQIRRYSL